MCVRGYSYLPQHLLSWFSLEINPSLYLGTWSSRTTRSISQLALLLGMVWGDVNGDIWIFQEDCLKEANLAGRTDFFRSCLYSFFLAWNSSSYLETWSELEHGSWVLEWLERQLVSDDNMKQLYKPWTAYSSFVCFIFNMRNKFLSCLNHC